jgi:peptide methionine sulfoxide reductase MsrA
LDRQGNDIGNQYRSIILYANDLQKQTAKDIMQEWQDENPKGTMVTELKPLRVFHSAEAYHHRYYEKNSRQPYCRMVVEPKLQKMLQSKYQSMIE